MHRHRNARVRGIIPEHRSCVRLDLDARRRLDPQSQPADQRLGNRAASRGKDASERLA